MKTFLTNKRKWLIETFSSAYIEVLSQQWMQKWEKSSVFYTWIISTIVLSTLPINWSFRWLSYTLFRKLASDVNFLVTIFFVYKIWQKYPFEMSKCTVFIIINEKKKTSWNILFLNYWSHNAQTVVNCNKKFVAWLKREKCLLLHFWIINTQESKRNKISISRRWFFKPTIK